MRTISPAALAMLSETQGVEPINLVQIYWNHSTPIWYCDRKFEQSGIIGRLLELSNLENIINVTKASNTEAISIKIDDSDNSIKNIFDQNDIHKSKVYVCQWFLGIPLSDSFVIFEGEISTPIVWKEGERTISFEVLSNIYDKEVGFSAEEGNFEYIPPNLVGQAWPLPFGTVQRVPALQINELPEGLLNADTTLSSTLANNRNNNLIDSYNEAFKNANDCRQKAAYCFTQAQNAHWEGVPITQIFTLPSTSNSEQTASTTADQFLLSAQQYQDQALQYENQMKDIAREMFNQSLATSEEENPNELTVQGGGEFPQGVPTTLNIGGTNYTGVFSGETFTVLSEENIFDSEGGLSSGPLTISEGEVAVEYSELLAAQSFFYALAGTAVKSNEALHYVISLFQVTNVGIFAQYNGITTAVPSTYYSINYVDFGVIDATYVTFPKALSLIDSKWSDEIYCTITSPIGPNIVDILTWLIETYTTKSCDPTTFASVRTKVQEYPANFAITSRENIVTVLKDIAFQARCAIWQKQGVFYLKFLPDDSAYVDTITEADVEFGTLEITCTDTEELVTKYVASYKIFENQTRDNLIIWRYNVAKYGLIEKKDDYYIYNNKELVERVSLFWLIRWCNTWKRIKFSTFLTKLKLETFDTVLLNFNRPWVANEPVPGLVESCNYNSSDNRIELTIWIPVRFGEMTKYPFAAPAGIDPTLIFPQQYEEANAGGGGIGSEVGSENTEVLYPQVGNNKKSTKPNSDSGGIAPSDVGYTAPTVESVLDPNELNRGTNPRNSSLSKQYIIKPVKDVNLGFNAPGVYPGFVTGLKSGKIYFVDTYFNGLSNTPTNIEVTQLQINSEDTIPEGTPTVVIKNNILISTDSRTGFKTYDVEYTMNVPVWLTSPITDDPLPDVPNPDEGETSEEVDEIGEDVPDAEPIDDEGSGDEPIIDEEAGDLGET